ncbi:MAG: glucosamine-6-phosphate deaminase, partial [Chloroflexota bacterium]|nr:glucosamine-6-phosphate deaminase [Chloroflexota bacterium]
MTAKLRTTPDEPSFTAAGADIVCDVVRAVPNGVLTFATGQSAMPIYRELAARVDRGEIDFSEVRVFELDGYVGIPLHDRRSLHAWLLRDVIVPLRIPERAVTRLRGEASDPVSACRDYDLALDRAGGYDLAILGLGPNGHIAFNEPPADPESDAHVLDVTEESVESAVRYWGSREDVPRRAITTGLRRLIAARRVLLLARGEAKRAALDRALRGEADPMIPASFLN